MSEQKDRLLPSGDGSEVRCACVVRLPGEMPYPCTAEKASRDPENVFSTSPYCDHCTTNPSCRDARRTEASA